MMGRSCNCSVCNDDDCLCGPYADFFDVLSNNNRIHIINALRKGEKNVSQICELTHIEQTAVSHNLRHLQTMGFVTSKRDGKFVIYQLQNQTRELMHLIDLHVKKHNLIEVHT